MLVKLLYQFARETVLYLVTDLSHFNEDVKIKISDLNNKQRVRF